MAIAPGIYNTGTATVASGGLTVSFQGVTNLQAAIRPGDRFGGHVGFGIRIATVGADTVTLAHPWPGAAQTAAPYEIVFTPYDLSYREEFYDIIKRYGRGALPGIAEVDGDLNTILYGTGTNTFARTALTAFARTLLDDGDAGAARQTLGFGDFGLTTAAITVTDANNAPLGSFSGFDGTETTAAAANFPALGGGSTPRRWGLATYGESTRTTQIATEVYGVGTTRGRTFVRVKHDSTWYPWREIGWQADVDAKFDKSGGSVSGTIDLSLSGLTGWHFQSLTQASIANGAAYNFPDGSGMALVTEINNGQSALFIMGGDSIVIAAQTGGTPSYSTSPSPSTGMWGAGRSGGHYYLINNRGGPVTLSTMFFRTRDTA